MPSPLVCSFKMEIDRFLERLSGLAVTAEDFVQREVRVDEEGNDEVKEEGEEVSSLGSSKHSFPHPPRGKCHSLHP